MLSMVSLFLTYSVIYTWDINEGPSFDDWLKLFEPAYDVCVRTVTIAVRHFGPFDVALDGLARVRSHLKDPVYGVWEIMTPFA